jgi:uncharacterized membrane protein YfcA
LELELLALAALGFAVGAYGTTVGLGGGFILIPLLLLLYPHYDPEDLTAISLAVVWANATSGAIAYARHRRIDYLTGLLLATCSLPGVVAGVFLVGFLPQRLFTALFALLLLVVAAIALRGMPRGIRRPLAGPGVLRRAQPAPEGTYRYAYRIWQGVVISLGVGIVSSLFGIGGGAFHVPAMIFILHVPIQFAVATSTFILIFMSGGATAVHLAQGTLSGDPLLQALALAAGTIPGAQLGARIAGVLRPRQTLALLAVSLAALAARMILGALLDA